MSTSQSFKGGQLSWKNKRRFRIEIVRSFLTPKGSKTQAKG